MFKREFLSLTIDWLSAGAMPDGDWLVANRGVHANLRISL